MFDNDSHSPQKQHGALLPKTTVQYQPAGRFELGQAPTTKEAQAIADALYAEFVGLDVDKVELIYTKFVSLISSDPIIQTLLPLTPQVCAYSSCHHLQHCQCWGLSCN